MSRKFMRRLLLFGLLIGFGAGRANGQWTTQTIALVKGWNAVYLNVSPESTCDQLFAGINVAAVYQHNPSLSAQYETSPAQPLQRAPEWLTWHNGGSNSLPPTLFSLQAGQAYLFSNDAPYTLVLTGRVETIFRQWRPDDWHLTGFDVTPGAGVPFAQYFGTEMEHIAKLQRVDSDGVSRDIDSGTAIERGRAYWIKTKGKLDFDGPVSIEGGIWLTASDATATLTVSNRSTSASNTVTFTLTDSLLSSNAVPLMRWSDSEGVYLAVLPETPFSVKIAPSAAVKLVFMANATGLQAGQTCHSLLQVIGGGQSSTLPVTYVNTSFGADRSAWPYGLWVGEVSLTDVSFVGEQDSVMSAASQPLDVRLILHHSTNGELRLLSRVVGVLETNDLGSTYRLYTDDNKLPDVTSNEVFRISSLAFGMMPPLNLSGSFLGSEPSVGSWTIDANDPLNPYRHVFNNDLQEAFSITNQVTFTWMDGTNAPLLSGTAWKPNGYCAGEYEQRISGVRHQEIRTRGMFRLEWISGTGTLE
ncbi:MAG: hypothetical protein PHG65_07675 [Kiritimatiellae bacterium]|nr:hypothetical protein [Kiritimatiellia bacterium]